jgi:hypothetical protein
MARILVVEPVAQAGVDILTASHETHVGLNLRRRLAEPLPQS